MFDIFYSGTKPNLFAHEREADSIEHAQQLSRTRYFWWVNYLADLSTWDWLYVPKPWQAHQRHAWPSQHQPDSGVYLVPKNGFVDTNYHASPMIHVLPDMSCWHIPEHIDPASIDPRWSPDPASPPYIYHFPVEWSWDRVGGPEYHVPGATERKYVQDFVAKTLPNPSAWTVHDRVDPYNPLLNWRPCPTDPPYNYVFGNQWWPGEKMATAEYRMIGAVATKYMHTPKFELVEYHDNHWHTLEDCEFDYSWIPDPGDLPYIYVFGNQWHSAEKFPTVEYHVPGATERKFMSYPKAELLYDMQGWNSRSDHRYSFDYTWKPDPGEPPMTYVFGNQWWPAEKMPTIEWSHANITEDSPVKYMNYPRVELLPNDTLWTVPDTVDSASLDFSWVPDPGAPPYIYQFATQHQKTGGPIYTVPGATEVKYLEELKVQTSKVATAVVEIDHLDGNAGQIPDTLKRVRYFDNYRDTLVRIAKSIGPEHEYIWVCSSICDYEGFDFSWHPEQWQATMLHVFASEGEKFGDTFFMHVPTFAERGDKKALLEWYDVNFVDTSVPRRSIPVIEHNFDSQAEAVRTLPFDGPLALYTTTDYVHGNLVTVPLWRQETKTIVPLSTGATSVIVPKAAVGDIKTQLYDYPYIDKTLRLLKDQPLDIVFISNGETGAEANYLWLKTVTRHDNNRIHLSDGVNGRVAAYQAAARASTTPWFFAVFAKLEVDKVFDWSWQPDRMQQAKHYIFHALNPVNGLQYGHQAMIAYNKKLVLENTGAGLDFTLDQAHEVVPIRCGTANYHTSNWMCWRTAFRECIKLKASLPDVENEYRLEQWLTKDNTPEQWSIKGAEDAVEFYDLVGGDFAELRKSYDWAWLASYAFMRRSLTTDQ
jgi:hypothetical protein